MISCKYTDFRSIQKFLSCLILVISDFASCHFSQHRHSNHQVHKSEWESLRAKKVENRARLPDVAVLIYHHKCGDRRFKPQWKSRKINAPLRIRMILTFKCYQVKDGQDLAQPNSNSNGREAKSKFPRARPKMYRTEE